MRRIFIKRRRVTRRRLIAAAVVVVGGAAAIVFHGGLSFGSGSVKVISGDTLRIGEMPVRLAGIDAPDQDQTCRRSDGTVYPCGEMAATAMKQLVEGSHPKCRERSLDRYGRQLAVCYAGGRDLGRAMVRAGWALTHRNAPVTYIADEASARAQQRGMWAGSFVPPSEWRLQQLQASSGGAKSRSYGFTR